MKMIDNTMQNVGGTGNESGEQGRYDERQTGGRRGQGMGLVEGKIMGR